MNHRKRLYTILGAAVLCAAVCLTAASCKNNSSGGGSGKGIPSDGSGTDVPNTAVGDKAQVYRDSKLGSTIVFAGDMKNQVQGYYENGNRANYIIKNADIQLSQRLTGYQTKYIDYVKNSENGNHYFENTMEPYIKTDDGKMYYSGNSQANGRMNTTRLGYYYYETHIRDLNFGSTASSSGSYLYSADISGFEDSVWTSNLMSAPVYSGGTMTVKVTDPYDPYVYREGLNIPMNQYNAIEVTLKMDGTSSEGDVFFYTDASGSFNGEQRTRFSITNDGEYHTYLIDLSSTGLINGALRGIRFDIGSAAGETVTFKSVKAVKADISSVPFKLDKTFHTYPDKLHQEYRIIATDNASGISEYGLEVKFPADRVVSFKVKDGKDNFGYSEYIPNGAEGIHYVAFDIKDTGIVGFIIPDDGLTDRVSVSLESGFVVFRQMAAIPSKINAKSEYKFGNRLYTDSTHTYKGIDEQAYIERNPLSDVQVSNASSSGCKYIGYDMLRGAYRFTMNGTDFNNAYYNIPDKHFKADISIAGDQYDRSVYMWINGAAGNVEGAAVLDEAGKQVPIPVEVCKNFQGEFEEPFYDPQDKQYGDSFYPIQIEAFKTVKHTTMQLYQNWGIFPLKQISSIQFHITYYHLSTGVTESNCIAPYFVYGKDEWTLPDFRGCSGDMWADQPQFNAVGRLRFVSYNNGAGKIKAEYTGSDIRSAGLTYADIDYNYISDCGSYEYSLRHVEFPQNDENRTYYTLELKFLKDLDIKNVKENFTLFNMDGRAGAFSKLGYLDASGNIKYKDMKLTEPFAETILLDKNKPYFSYFGLGGSSSPIMNFAYMVKNYDITIGGQKWNGNFVLRNTYDGSLNNASISIDEGDVSFKKGDTIKLNFILLPWGSYRDTDDKNVRTVFEDSVKNPIRITAQEGTVVPDDYLPVVRTDQNSATFTLTGGRNRSTVRIDGFTKFGKPTIYEIRNGVKYLYVTSKNSYDGYTVQYNSDGTYSYSFVYETQSPVDQRTFQIVIQ